MERAARKRVVVARVEPEIECGRFPIKRVVGEPVVVEADVFSDGHDRLHVRLMHRSPRATGWIGSPMESLPADRWRGMFVVDELGTHRYGVRAWIDRFGSWRLDVEKRLAALQDITPELDAGAELVEQAAEKDEKQRDRLLAAAEAIRGGDETAILDEWLALTVGAIEDELSLCEYGAELRVVVDRERARFSTWYELFPRSVGDGTFNAVEEHLSYVKKLGADVLYLPPIHPIGLTHRKGRNNATTASAGDPGSPWAIGSEEGGHEAIHPSLGTVDDFTALAGSAKSIGIEIALDLALQCSPDHPWVQKHPQWFRHRPDGSIRFAENPPKKYEDIYPIDFETDDWRALWDEIRSVVQTWIDRGVRIFRVDNPHTKPFRFWEWLIGDVKDKHPDVLFLAEAFTTPRVMEHLAKLGFTQSYSYFAWRNAKWELESYFNELTKTDKIEYYRANLWPNTPDILTEYLQHGGRAAFIARLVLAATLGASYGIYGPAFELQEHEPFPGKEEYVNNEKYEIKHWELDRPDSLAPLVARVNEIRHQHPALQQERTLRFHPTDNDAILCYSKAVEGDVIVVCVNVDPHRSQAATIDLQIHDLWLDTTRPYGMRDLLTGARYQWFGWQNYVELHPSLLPAHIFHIEQG
ncbi:MAG: alpha-1,4-glucan--maltose-1-phosphate maltosyltransferase [Actinomycetota bacterium]